MTNNQKQWAAFIVLLISIVVAGALGVVYPMPEMPTEPLDTIVEGEESDVEHLAISRTRIRDLLIDRGNIQIGHSTPDVALDGGDLFVSDAFEADGAARLGGNTALGDAAGDTTTVTGDMFLAASRDATSGNDYFFEIEGESTGIAANTKTYGQAIWLERPAGYEITVGDMQDTGLIVRVDTHAVTTTSGTVIRAVDAEAKLDNPSGTASNVFGGLFTAKSDSGAGAAANMVALSANVHTGTQADAVTGTLISGDFRIARFSPTEPTEEYVLHVRSASEAGTGVDAAIFIESDYSGQTDDFNYGVDMSAADIDDGDIRFQNGTVLEETTDTILTFSEFLAGETQTTEFVSGGSTIDPTGTWQPLSSTGAVTCSTSTCITNGTKDGQLLILINVNASDVITIDGTGGNVECKNNVALGTKDTLGLVWYGSLWHCLFNYDNS